MSDYQTAAFKRFYGQMFATIDAIALMRRDFERVEGFLGGVPDFRENPLSAEVNELCRLVGEIERRVENAAERLTPSEKAAKS